MLKLDWTQDAVVGGRWSVVGGRCVVSKIKLMPSTRFVSNLRESTGALKKEFKCEPQTPKNSLLKPNFKIDSSSFYYKNTLQIAQPLSSPKIKFYLLKLNAALRVDSLFETIIFGIENSLSTSLPSIEASKRFCILSI